MESVLKCKMRVYEVTHIKNPDGSTQREIVKLYAVAGGEGAENGQWSKWTPSADFTIHINNPQAFNRLSSGHEYYVDFSPANVTVSAG